MSKIKPKVVIERANTVWIASVEDDVPCGRGRSLAKARRELSRSYYLHGRGTDVTWDERVDLPPIVENALVARRSARHRFEVAQRELRATTIAGARMLRAHVPRIGVRDAAELLGVTKEAVNAIWNWTKAEDYEEAEEE